MDQEGVDACLGGVQFPYTAGPFGEVMSRMFQRKRGFQGRVCGNRTRREMAGVPARSDKVAAKRVLASGARGSGALFPIAGSRWSPALQRTCGSGEAAYEGSGGGSRATRAKQMTDPGESTCDCMSFYAKAKGPKAVILPPHLWRK